jgi:predicted SAM-dependent methyltransferase
MKLNLGCGNTKNEGYVNIDADAKVEPDLCFDFVSNVLPYEDGSIEQVTMFHTIEHISRDFHQKVICDINRVLRLGGDFMVSYPDAERCGKNFLENKWGMRDYWEKTLLGRGNTIWDMHRALIVTSDFLSFLREFGFGKYKVMEEAGQFHNTVIQAVKTFTPMQMADILKRELNLDGTQRHDSAAR